MPLTLFVTVQLKTLIKTNMCTPRRDLHWWRQQKRGVLCKQCWWLQASQKVVHQWCCYREMAYTLALPVETLSTLATASEITQTLKLVLQLARHCLHLFAYSAYLVGCAVLYRSTHSPDSSSKSLLGTAQQAAVLLVHHLHVARSKQYQRMC